MFSIMEKMKLKENICIGVLYFNILNKQSEWKDCSSGRNANASYIDERF